MSILGPGEFRGFDELHQWVIEEGDLVAVTGEALRDAAGWSRMTDGTVSAIYQQLKQRALGCYPPLTANRHAEYRIYKKGTQTGNLIEAVLYPSVDGDQKVRESASGAAQEILAKIEQLVCKR